MEPTQSIPEQVQKNDEETKARREFIKKMSKASAAAPAVALLMAANFKSANAQSTYGGGCGSGSS